MPRRFDAVLFDLLTALLDSWTLWDTIAGDPDAGRRWRGAYLRLTYRAGAYRPYEALVAEAAAETGLDVSLAGKLAERYADLRPWPGVVDELASLSAAGVPLGIASNCSEALGRTAAACMPIRFAVVVTAERAGFYKPDPRPYELALSAMNVTPERCLFVAGSAFDLFGASRVGLPVWWHNRIGLEKPPEAPEPLRHTRTAAGLAQFVLGE